MINHNLKPTEKYIDFVEPTENRPRLKITINIYDTPFMYNRDVSIYSVINIDEEYADGKYIFYGNELYSAMLTESQVNEAFRNIKQNPELFKVKHNVN